MRRYFNINLLIKAFFTAVIFSSFIYLAYFDINMPYLESFFGLLSFYVVLKAGKKELFWTGFFTGVLWFYWIALSFRYYGLSWMIPIMILFIGFVYGILFWTMGYLSEKAVLGILKKVFKKEKETIFLFFQVLIKSLFLLLLSHIHPFGFNWFVPELVFINSIFDTTKISFAVILLALLTLFVLPKKVKFLAFLPLVFALKGETSQPTMPPLKIYLSQTKIPQDKKWDPRYLNGIIKENFSIIDRAIEKNYDLVVLPESAFPLFLNREENIINLLKKRSLKIAIVTGALHLKGKLVYNSSFFFNKGEMTIADKVVLVPFGEEIPLPSFLGKWINEKFYNGAEDYQKASKPTDFVVKGINFRNAICYEATHPKLYAGDPKYMIAISNNAWFIPSIEPVLQNLLIKYYAEKHGTVVFHSTNIAKTDIIW
ncbi:apolipoprotein N-acyltransferase [Nitrosophilus alvini]|uniref:apolipoprotein N-acyltransferase n=1 Tax=Nitrosophilus alvini TaxID=2714855 RepID=UPI00190DDC6B|nr:apolipoprotein N-acyltransferase [Nitrosophilus alvini]